MWQIADVDVFRSLCRQNDSIGWRRFRIGFPIAKVLLAEGSFVHIPGRTAEKLARG